VVLSASEAAALYCYFYCYYSI